MASEIPENIDVMEIHGEELFQHFETTEFGTISPIVKNILILLDADRVSVIAKIDNTFKREMETFMRNDFINAFMKPRQTLANYFGIYATCKENFKFTTGQEASIDMLVGYCQNVLKQRGRINHNPDTAPVAEANNIMKNDNDFMDIENFQRATTYDDLFRHIGSLLIFVFNDAKRTTLSGWSFPSRYVASQLSQNYKRGIQSTLNINLQYVTPSCHAQFLNCIVDSDLDNLREILTDSLAASLRFDGSVDRTQKHNVFVIIQVVKSDGKLATLCIGFDIPKKKGAAGYLKCIKKIASRVLPWEEIFALITSLVTDGENLNLGRLNGLVAMLKELRRASSSASPLFSIWCVPHRTNLAWKTVSNTTKSIADIITRARKLSKHFRRSGKRTQALKDVATANYLKQPLRYPAFFAVRWVEYIYKLFNTILRNWRASMLYFRSVNETTKFFFWKHYDTLHFITFLTDILFLIKTFQKACQSDSITLLEVAERKANLIKRLENCINGKVDGGWEECLAQNIVTNGHRKYLYGIELKLVNSFIRTVKGRRTVVSTSFTLQKRRFIIQQLIQNFNVRLELDNGLLAAMEPLRVVSLSTPTEDLELCHSTFAPDFGRDQFVSDYYGAAEILNDYQCKTTLESLQKIIDVCPENLTSLKLALARVSAAKPHSADVERLIS